MERMSRGTRRTVLGGLVASGLVIGNVRFATAQDSEPLTVSAASDLTPAFSEIGALFEAKTGTPVAFNFGSTGQLTQQIESGAPVDVFAAANVSYIDQLDAEGLILPGTKAPYARGRIVIWTRADSPLDITTLQDLANPDIAHLAIANPDHAPYGVAAREAMQSAGVWDAIQDRLVLGENISDTLRLAESGNVDVAIVALSLSINGDGKWTLIPENLHKPIDQALAVITSTDQEDEARAFAAFVNSDTGRDVMRRYGFILPGESLPAATPDASPVASPVS